jgi:hypothetical protein
MDVRILDLDGSLPPQRRLFAQHCPALYAASGWGPHIRLACSFGRFRRFEGALARLFGSDADEHPALTLYGSGDFHHVSLALLHRLRRPVNLLVLDNHPDWMRGVPFLHCGTWLYHAARLPEVHQIIHVGGDVDFDNYYQALAPWPQLRSGKIIVFPGRRRFERGGWAQVAPEAVRSQPGVPTSLARIEKMIRPLRDELRGRPLYISLDKDVMVSRDAVVNWDSGHLTLPEVSRLLEVFLRAAGGKVAGMDVVGDWSEVRLRGWLRHLMHWTMHPGLTVEPDDARQQNERTNLTLVEDFCAGIAPLLERVA